MPFIFTQFPTGQWSANTWPEIYNQILSHTVANMYYYTDISCLGGVFAKNTSRETKNFQSQMAREFQFQDWYFSQIPLPNMIYLFNYTEYYLEHWLNKYNSFCLSFSGPNMMYLFNSTEWCYINRTIDNVLLILLQASRWRLKTANTIVAWNAQLILLYLTNFSLA